MEETLLVNWPRYLYKLLRLPILVKYLINKQKMNEHNKEIEFSEKIDELNQETDTLLEEIDKWQM